MAHHHTSYPTLAFLLLITTVLVAAFSTSSHAADSTLSLSVSGAPPTTGATITAPADSVVITDSTTTVRGTCGNGLRVEITRNGSFVGSTMCDNGSLFSIVITLTPGSNTLAARNFDGADQPGPATPSITVVYAPPAPTPTPTPSPTPVATPRPLGLPAPSPTPSPRPAAAPSAPSATAAPLMLNVGEHYYNGIVTGVGFYWPVTLTGGSAPYKVTIDWGDGGQTSLAPAAGTLDPSHTYTTAGIYHLTATASDHSGQHASISIVAIVTGASTAAITSGPSKHDTAIWVAWPMLAGAALITVSFWLGEGDLRHRARVAAAAAASANVA